MAPSLTEDASTSAGPPCDPSRRTADLVSHIYVVIFTKACQNKVINITAVDEDMGKGRPLCTAIGNVTGMEFWRTLWTATM